MDILKITPRNRYAQKPTYQVIIDSVKLTTNTTTLKMCCVNLVCQTLLGPGASLHLFPSCFATRRDGFSPASTPGSPMSGIIKT